VDLALVQMLTVRLWLLWLLTSSVVTPKLLPLRYYCVERGSCALIMLGLQAPGFGDNRKATLQDIAILTGAQLISNEVGLKVETATIEQLGSCKKVYNI
jgi:hypothetical protein